MEYDFELILAGQYEDIPEEIDAAVYHKCPNANGIGVSCCVLHVDFYFEESANMSDAVLSAIQQIESNRIGIVERVEPDELVGLSDIGRRLGMSREAIRLYANGAMGPGEFPHPVATPSKNARVWRWLDVVNWFLKHGIANVDEAMAEHAGAIATINAALELRRHIGTKKALLDLWKELQTPAVKA